MPSWFGSLDLAYKYALVFGSALGLTLILGFIKVIYDRRQLSRFLKEQEDLEASKRSIETPTMPIAMREKDEGDLFGVRAIEAGFFGGVAQSAPVSRAGSIAGSRPGSIIDSRTGSMEDGRSLSPGADQSNIYGYPSSNGHPSDSSTTLIHQQNNPTLSSRGIPVYKGSPDSFKKGMHDNITISASSSMLSLGSSTRKST